MFSFFYHHKYFTDRNSFPTLRYAWDINTHAHMYNLGVEFAIPRLRKLAARKFKHALKDFEERGRWDELRRSLYFEEFLSVTDYVFSSTHKKDGTLRRIVFNFIDFQIRRSETTRLRVVYRAILGVLQEEGIQKDFAPLITDIQVQHLAWLSSLLSLKRPITGSDDGSDLSIETPLSLKRRS